MRVVVPSHDGFRLSASALELLPPIIDPAQLVARVCATITDEVVRTSTTALGWPCTIARGRRDDQIVVRVLICFLDHSAMIEAVLDTADEQQVWDVISYARPDWGGEIAAIHQLFL